MTNRTLRIFISSPGDVAEEREKARQVVEGLQRQFPSVELKPVLWEELPLPATASFQETIDYLLSAHPIDIAIFILWSRLGTPLGPAAVHRDGTPYRSGTEREFDLMLEAFEQSGQQRPIILAYAREDHESFVKRVVESREDTLQELLEQRTLVQSFIREHFRDEQGHNLRAYHSYKEPVSFAQRLQVHLREVLNELVVVEAAARWSDAPYRGLESFDIEHAAIFQGRDHETCEVLQRLRDQERSGRAFVVILGASGSGKSSLARAGVAATLVHHAYEDGIREWKIAVFVPGLAAEDLLGHLLAVLAERLPELATMCNARRALTESLAQDGILRSNISVELALAQTALRTDGGLRLLLIVDQLEELWTDRRFSTSHREQFFDLLETLAKSRVVAVLATLRSDFYSHAQIVPTFLRLKGDRGQFDLLPPGPVALHRLIAEPARLAGLEFEFQTETGRKLDEVITEDASKDPAALPLLEYALSELYERRDTARRRLTFAAYEQLGRVDGALGQRASEQFQQLHDTAKKALPEILPLLVTIDGAGEQVATRRRAALADVIATPERKELTDALIATRFLTTDCIGADAVVSLAHEALLSKWTEVSEWVSSNRELLGLRARVEQEETRWKQHDRHASLLLAVGLPLEEGRKLLKSGSFLLSTETGEYIQESIKTHEAAAAQRHRNRRAVLIGLGCLTAVALIAAGYARLKQVESASLASDNALLAQKMKKSAETATTLAGEKATLAEQMKDAADRATALAVEKSRLAAAEEVARIKADAETQKAQKLATDNEQLAVRERIAREDAEKEFARAENERARAEAGRYQVQLARVRDLGPDDPEQAVQLLQSTSDCPHELRDFTWSFLFAEALTFPDRTARILELKTASAANVIAYAPHGRQLAVGHADGTVTLWDTTEQKPRSALQQHSGPVMSLAFSPDGETLASGGEDARVHLWDLDVQKARRTLTGHTGPIVALDFSTDGTLILTGSNAQGQSAASPPPDPNRVPDPADVEPGQLIVWSSPTGERHEGPFPGGGVRAARFQPQTHAIVIGRSGETTRLDLDRGESELWPPLAEGQQVLPPAGFIIRFATDCLAFSADGTRFCSVSHRTQTGNEQHSSEPSRLTTHASAVLNRVDRDPPALPELKPLRGADEVGHPAPPPIPLPVGEQDAAIPPSLIPQVAPLLPDRDNMPVVPQLQVYSQTLGHPRRILCAALSPDGRTLVTGDREGHLQLRDPITGGIRLTLRAHQGAVQSVTFSPDGSELASASGGPSSKVIIQRILPAEMKILADKVGHWRSARELMQAGYDAGAIFGTATNVALSELHLADAEAELFWAAGAKKLAVRKLAQAAQHAERYADGFRQQGELGLVRHADRAAAMELLGRARLAHHRTAHAADRSPVKPVHVSASRHPILWRLTGGLPTGSAPPNERQILEEMVKAAETQYRRAQLRSEAGVGAAMHAYDHAAKYDLARAALLWAKKESTAIDRLQSAAMFMEWASPLTWLRNHHALMPSPANWDPLSQSCDMQRALAQLKQTGVAGEVEVGLEDVIAHAEIELTGNPGAEELRIFGETIRSLEEIQRIVQQGYEAGGLTLIDVKLMSCRILQAKADRAWAAGQIALAERFLAEAVNDIADARTPADALFEEGHPDSDRIYPDVVWKQLEIRLAHARIQRADSEN